MKALRVHFLLCTGLLFLGITTVSAQKIDTYNLDETYPISQNGTIELHSDDAGLVEINGSDRTDVRLLVTYRREIKGVTLGKQEKFAMEVVERNGNLIIRERPSDSGINLNIGAVNRKYTITILAPQHANLDLYGDDDTYEISETNGNIQIEADDSDISLRDCNGADFNFDIDDGELIMDNGRGSLTMNFNDGDADIRNSKFTNVDIESDDGDINLSTTLTDDGRYSLATDDGSIDLTVLGGGGTIRVDHDGVRVSTGSKFKQLSRNENYNEYELAGGSAQVQIETDDGDIRLFAQ